MANYHTVPDSATLIEEIQGILPSGKWNGQHITMRRLSSHYGKIEWLQLIIKNGPTYAKQCSGKNKHFAKQQIQEMREAIQ